MNRILLALLASIAALSQPVAARDVVYQVVEEAVYFEDDDLVELEIGGERFVAAQPAQIPAGIATFGPFRVLDATHAAMVDVTDTRTPAEFAAMVRAYPGIAVLRMVDCPGTEDDRANLRLGAMIRARGIATHVPRGGFVASGAVEIFLAGARRSAEPGAEFAVHSWADEDGREAKDYPADAPENRAYLEYYQRMGMSAPEAAAFYAMTNSVPFARAKRLTTADMGRWVRLERSELVLPDAPMLALAPAPATAPAVQPAALQADQDAPRIAIAPATTPIAPKILASLDVAMLLDPVLGVMTSQSPGYMAVAMSLGGAMALDSGSRLN